MKKQSQSKPIPGERPRRPQTEGIGVIEKTVFVDGQALGVVEVFYRRVIPTGAEGPFLKEEDAPIRAVAERVGGARMHVTPGTRKREGCVSRGTLVL